MVTLPQVQLVLSNRITHSHTLKNVKTYKRRERERERERRSLSLHSPRVGRDGPELWHLSHTLSCKKEYDLVDLCVYVCAHACAHACEQESNFLI